MQPLWNAARSTNPQTVKPFLVGRQTWLEQPQVGGAQDAGSRVAHPPPQTLYWLHQIAVPRTVPDSTQQDRHS